jgi:hypothetical protein
LRAEGGSAAAAWFVSGGGPQYRRQALIDMVMLVSIPDAPTSRLRENYLSEQVFEWAGIGAAHVALTL